MLNWLKKLLRAQPQPTAEAASTSIQQRPEPLALREADLRESDFTAAPEFSRSSETRWVMPGEVLTLDDYTLTHGMVYIGETLSGISEHVSIEPCLINPVLKVDSEQPDRAGECQ